MPMTVDTRGLACPQPVIRTRQALKAEDRVVAIVDNETSQHNVTRMAEKRGYTVQAETRDDGIYLHIGRDASVAPGSAPQMQTSAPTGDPLVLFVSSELMGRGEHEELGQILMRGFLHALGEVEALPQVIILVNSGVKLVVRDSPVAEDLRSLGEHGIEILVCGTCLEYYGFKDQVAVGEVSNIYTIAETLLGAGKVLNL